VNNKICPIILCGGSGKRLWPISRTVLPKQFLQTFSNLSLFQKTLLRVSGNIYSKPLIISSDKYSHIVNQQIKEISLDCHLICEPQPKNTSPSIMLALTYCLNNKIKNCLVLPCDHYIDDDKYFNKIINSSLKNISDYPITIFGIKPSNPSCLYGHIKVKNVNQSINRVIKFIEKPGKNIANRYYKEKKYLWNSGMFFFDTDTFKDALVRIECNTYFKVKKLLNYEDNKIQSNEWNKIKSLQFDKDVVEKLKNIRCVKYSSKWSDIGEIKEFIKYSDKLTKNNFISLNSKNIRIWNNGPSNILVSDLENIDIVLHDNALMICSSEKTNYTELSNEINNLGLPDDFTKIHRPWGWYQTLNVDRNFHIKQILIKPGEKLSLQSHNKRRELWLVLEGNARVTKGKKRYMLGINDTIQIDFKEIHRLENIGKKNVVIIEIQTGSYFGEDDIKRYSDIYGRKDDR